MTKFPPRTIREDIVKELEREEKIQTIKDIHSTIPNHIPKTIQIGSPSKKQDKDEIIKASVCIGFVAGACLKLGINVEEVILRPLFSGMDQFGLIVSFASITTLSIGLIYLFNKWGVLRGIGVFISSFLSAYIIIYSIETSSKIIVISVGLALLLLSFHFAGVFKKRDL